MTTIDITFMSRRKHTLNIPMFSSRSIKSLRRRVDLLIGVYKTHTIVKKIFLSMSMRKMQIDVKIFISGRSDYQSYRGIAYIVTKKAKPNQTVSRFRDKENSPCSIKKIRNHGFHKVINGNSKAFNVERLSTLIGELVEIVVMEP